MTRVPRKTKVLEDKQSIEGLKCLKQIYLEKDNSEGMWSVTLNCIQAGIDALRVPKEMTAEETIERIMAKLKEEGKGLLYLNGKSEEMPRERLSVEGIEDAVFKYGQDAIDPEYMKGLARAIYNAQGKE